MKEAFQVLRSPAPVAVATGPLPFCVLRAPSPDFRSVWLYSAFPMRSTCYQGKTLASPSGWAPRSHVCYSRRFCGFVCGGIDKDRGISAYWCPVCPHLPSAWGASCSSQFLFRKRSLTPLLGSPWFRFHESEGPWSDPLSASHAFPGSALPVCQGPLL